MDIRLIKYFLMVAQEQNITKAAQKLNMSQPPLSKQIKQLEEELGLQLFTREKNKMRLTEAGYMLKSYGESIVNLMEKTEKQLSELKEGVSGSISIAALESITTTFLPIWIGDFLHLHSKVNFNLWSGTTDEIVDKIEQGLFDIGIIRSPFENDSYEILNLPIEPWVVVMRKDNPLAADSSDCIPLGSISSQPLMVPSRPGRSSEIQQWFESIGSKANIILRFNNMINVVALVNSNVGIAICPISVKKIFFNDNLICKKIIQPAVTSQTQIIWKKNKYYSQATKEFIKYMKSAVPKVRFE